MLGLHGEVGPAPPLLQQREAALPAPEERAAARRARGDAEPPGLTRAEEETVSFSRDNHI